MDKNDLVVSAKRNLACVAKEIDIEMSKYWKQESENNFGFDPEQKKLTMRLLDHAAEHSLRTAKRLRGAFVYFGYLLGGKKLTNEVIKAGVALELIHTALLIHDDFMDEDSLRRGKQTTHEYFAHGDRHYGEAMAVCLGDVVMSMSYKKLLECEFDSRLVNLATRQMLKGIAETALGQAYDVSLPKMNNLSEEMILSLHRAKTAIYTFENPLLVGAILGEANDETKQLLREYSALAGVAFQLQDDILGVFGDEQKTGKSANSDLLQGKMTLLMLKTLEFSNEEQKKIVKSVWGNKDANSKDINVVKKIIKSSGAYDYSILKANNLIKESIEKIEVMRKMELNDEAIDFLEGIAWYVVNREI